MACLCTILRDRGDNGQERSVPVLLWESWLRHEVPFNKAREDRIAISFNAVQV